MGGTRRPYKEKEKCNMKTVYIPKGEIVRYESLMTEHLIVLALMPLDT